MSASEPVAADRFDMMIPRLIRQGGRFLGVGLLNTILTYLLYLALLLMLSYPVAYTVSFAVGIAFAAVANAGLVFRTRLGLRSALRFTAVYFANYAAGMSIVIGLVDWAHISTALAPLAATIVLFPLNFFG